MMGKMDVGWQEEDRETKINSTHRAFESFDALGDEAWPVRLIKLESVLTPKIPRHAELGEELWVFYARYSQFQGRLPQLSERETRIVEKFKVAHAARLYAFAHGVLRLVLGTVLSISPENLRFTADPNGKPRLLQPEGLSVVFNLSHSGDAVALAISREAEVGIDLERIRPFSDMAEMVKNLFHPRDIQFFDHLHRREKIQGFYRLWTQKEAMVKAVGTGLVFPLEKFCIPGMDGGLCELPGGSRGQVVLFTPWPDYVGAVAVEGHL